MNKRGFTLAEVLVGVAIFLVSATAFSLTLSSAKQVMSSAKALSPAIYQLQAKMEELKLVSFTSLSSFNGTRFARQQGTIHVTPVTDNLLNLQLELNWQNNKAPLTLSALRSNLL